MNDTSTPDTEKKTKTLSEEELVSLDKRVNKGISAKEAAIQAQRNRVSRRLLLAERAKRITLTCTETGITSQMDIPSIPGFALTYIHPLSSYQNCRGIASRGMEYLRKLDTQTLAGVLIVLADHYELFRWDPLVTGAAKNALLRTAGKDSLIDLIVIVECQIHSNNCDRIPKLSFTVADSPAMEQDGIQGRIKGYSSILLEAIYKPDLTPMAEVKPVGKPLYIKDKEREEKRISFLARQELAEARKTLKEDQKSFKELVGKLFDEALLTIRGKQFLLSQSEAMGTEEFYEPDANRDQIVKKLKEKDSLNAAKLIDILLKDRKILWMDISEIEFEMGSTKEVEEESKTFSEEFEEKRKQREVQLEEGMPTPPDGLSYLEKKLWIKKWKEAKKRKWDERSEDSPDGPISSISPIAVYTPSHSKEILGKDTAEDKGETK